MTGTLEWHFGQVFGERSPGEEIQDADIISAVEFDERGEFLATGDHGGRVVLFERVGGPPPPRRSEIPMDARPPPQHVGFNYEYRYLTEFQSHEPEFDYLKSLEIEEKINCVRWVRRDSACLGAPSSHLLLTTNDKTIKLWKVYQKEVLTLGGGQTVGANGPYLADENAQLYQSGPEQDNNSAAAIQFPPVEGRENLWTSRRRKTFANAHAYHINTVSMCSDKETFLSADDLRINLWNLDVGPQAFTIVDIKPGSMEDLTEVITRAAFHPTEAHCLAYSTSRGAIRMCDLRKTALADQHVRQFEANGGADGGAPKNFFSEIISSISDFRFFGPDDRRIVARDFMTVKIWDIAMEREPLEVHNVHEPLRSRLVDLYESDSLFDKFDVCISGDGRHIGTGTYSSLFRVCDRSDPAGTLLLEASRDPTRRRLQPTSKHGSRFGLGRTKAVRPAGGAEESVVEDLGSKILRMSWHPHAAVVATAAANSLYLFEGRPTA